MLPIPLRTLGCSFYHDAYARQHLRPCKHKLTDYDDLLKEIISYYFSERIAQASGLAVKINDVIVDPGFGFAKTLEQNFEFLNNLELFTNRLTLPLLAGVSRKSMIYKTLNSSS
jgi:dihydropteroate synthase